MKITTVEVFNTTDKNCIHDHIQRFMFVDDELILKGSNLKNSVDQMINGAIAFVSFRGINFTHEKIRIASTELYYDFVDKDITPQQWLQKVRNHPDVEKTMLD